METILTTLIRSMNWQGGTIHQVLSALPTRTSYLNNSAYSYGYREGKAKRNGICFASYSIPFNSWDDDKACNISYACGLRDGLNSI